MMPCLSSVRLLRWILGIGAMLVLVTGRSVTADDPKVIDGDSQIVLDKLESRISFDFPKQTPLWDVINYMSVVSQEANDEGIPFVFDEENLKKVGKNPHSLIPIAIKGDFTQKAVLEKLLKSMKLAYSVQRGVLVIGVKPDGDKQKP